jgi:hypothetical protein
MGDEAPLTDRTLRPAQQHQSQFHQGLTLNKNTSHQANCPKERCTDLKQKSAFTLGQP